MSFTPEIAQLHLGDFAFITLGAVYKKQILAQFVVVNQNILCKVNQEMGLTVLMRLDNPEFVGQNFVESLGLSKCGAGAKA